ncbi:MAG: discoidin domain-containing protein, partial [Bacteroidales bacterium]|nr:discoidin domain-containing protein [Bacteroidales bacterium]
MKTKIELLIVLLSIICISNNSLNSFASTNLALNKPAFANDSAMDWAGPPRYANDGNLSTRWQSTKNLGTQIAPGRFAQNSWWMVDLQNTYNIEGVIIQWEAAAAIDYKIMVSTDNQQWNEVVSITNENGGTDRIRFSPVPTRYVKIVTTVGNMQYSPSMWEFEVYAENDFPLLTYYKQDFNKGITAEFSFWDDENNNASISIDTVAANNLCLNINNILPAQFSLVLNFDSIEKRNLSAFPFISFHYKADTTIAFKIAVINDSDTIYEESYRQIFAFNEWIEFMDSIRINPLSLLRIKALFLMFKTNKNNQIISIDNLAFGSLAEPYSFKILKPSRGSMLKPNESVKLITNAPEGSRVVIQLNNQNYAELSSAPYVIELNNLSEGFYHVKAIVYQGSIEVMHSESSFIVSGDNGFTYRNEATEYLFNSLKALTRSDFSMFGVANG